MIFMFLQTVRSYGTDSPFYEANCNRALTVFVSSVGAFCLKHSKRE